MMPKSQSTPSKKTSLGTKKTAKESATFKSTPTPTSHRSSLPSRKVPVGVWIFFGCSLLIFFIALYQSFLRPSDAVAPDSFSWDSILPAPQDTPDPQDSLLSGVTGDIIISDNVDERYPPETSSVAPSGPAFLQQFYEVFSQKDITTLTSLFDAPLQRSQDIRRFFSEYKITPFIDNIENNRIIPSNISLLATSPSGVEEYQYTLSYRLIPQDLSFEEERIAKVKYTDDGPKIASIRCETPRCSYNPFFRPESYGLIQ
jgi:hypothetical protein